MAEGERLQAELEKAEAEEKDYIIMLDAYRKLLETVRANRDGLIDDLEEARRWARKYYWLYLIERRNYLDTFTDGDEWDEV